MPSPVAWRLWSRSRDYARRPWSIPTVRASRHATACQVLVRWLRPHGALSLGRGGVNLLNPKERPELSIWDKREIVERLAAQASVRADATGAVSMLGALDAHSKKATAALTAWQDGIPLAGRKAQLLIGAAAVATSIVAVSVQVAHAALIDAAATATAAAGPTEVSTLSTQVRIGIEEIVNASSIADEQLAEEAIENATRQAYRALLPR